MKKAYLLLALFIIQSAFIGSMAATKSAKSPAEQLIQRLVKIQKKGYMYGHQDDPFYGITWDWEKDRSDTKELVGDYPAVMGFDLGGIELGDDKDLDGVPFDWAREEIRKQYERGGIVTISWHPRNPLLGTTAWIQNDTTAYNEAVDALKKIHREDLIAKIDNPKNTVKEILPGGKAYEKYQLWLKRVADYLLTLKDSKGNQIPVVFRPWHENNGSWFWWGQKLCTDEQFHQFWNMTQDYINAVVVTSNTNHPTSTTLKDYIVWSYSPNLQGNWTEEQWLVRYPGDDRVDVIGEDAYQWGTEEDYKSQLDADLQIITSIAQKHGKLIAMTECGRQNSPDPTWWQRVFKPVIEKYPVCWLLPWRNYSKDHFGASKDAKTADDFKAWAGQKNFLFVKDIKGIK